MCARRFLIAVFVLILLAVAGAFAIYQWGGNVILQQATPKGHFEAPPTAGGPDYGQSNNWLARPDMDPRSNPAEWRPANWPAPQAAPKRAAVFYVHPTSYLERDRWNAALLPGGQTEFRTRLFVQSQASAFNNVADVWAPRYRQAAFGAFLLKSNDARKALDLAYADVSRAFDEFLKRVGPDRPIILAGHSQGALHIARLLADRRAELSGRLVAAYAVGWPLSVAADLPAFGLPPCRSAAQVSCVLSWQSFGQPANPDMIMDAWAGTRGPTGIKRAQADLLCVNPITGTQNGAAPPQANLGTLIPAADFSNATLEAGILGAHCERGLLILDGQLPPVGPFVLPGNNYHPYDYALFWGAVAQDAARRTEAWQR
jgi:hypothetical protein